MKYILIFFQFVLILCVLTGCGGGSAADSFTVMTWNAQEFFDATEQGFEFPEFTGNRSRWNAARYQKRLEVLCDVVRTAVRAFDHEAGGQLAQHFMRDTGPDIVALQEIERKEIIQDIFNLLDYRCGYKYAAFSSGLMAPFGTAVLSRFPITRIAAHAVYRGNDSDIQSRPILEIECQIYERPVIFLICHWKSKTGQDYHLNTIQEAALSYRAKQIEEQKSGTALIMLGDFNRNIEEFTHVDDDLSFQHPLTAWSKIALLSLKDEPFICADPWTLENTPGAREAGSYRFQGKWQTLDHILLSEKTLNDKLLFPERFTVLNNPPCAAESGYPHRYEVFSGKGSSDHFPLIMKISTPEKVPSKK